MTFLFSLAFAFALALLMGRFMSRLRLPRATAYLMVGILAGKPLMNALTIDPLIQEGDGLRMLVDFTLGLILFGIGRRFRLAKLRRNLGKVLLVAAAEIVTTFVLVLGAVLLAGASVPMALLLGVIAVATAPAATILVIREYESEGPITDLTVLLVGINNLVSVLAFIGMLALLLPAGLGEDLPTPALAIGMPVAVGLLVGLVTAVWDARIDRVVERKLLAVAAISALVGLAEMYSFNPLLACLLAGLVVVNSSPRETALFDALQELDYPLYVLFFVLAGTRLHTGSLMHLGAVGGAYVLARAAGKLLGATAGVQFTRLGGRGRRWLGFALTAQAGVAIGLSHTLARLWPEVGLPVEATVLAAVVVFEIVGPPVVRTALVQSGEVKLMTLLVRRAPVGLYESAHQVVNHFRHALGVPDWGKLQDPKDIKVAQLMRKNVETIAPQALFDDVLKQLAATRYDRLLVVDGEQHLLGVINYADIHSVVVDASLAKLITASDLAAGSMVVLSPEDTVADAMAVLDKHADMTFVPVVAAAEQNRLLGIVSQNDVLSIFRKMR